MFAGAGFINFTLKTDTKTRVVSTVLSQAGDFGRSTLGSNANSTLTLGGTAANTNSVTARPPKIDPRAARSSRWNN